MSDPLGFLQRKNGAIVFRDPDKLAIGSIAISCACAIETDSDGDRSVVGFDWDKGEHALQVAQARWNGVPDEKGIPTDPASRARAVIRESPDLWRVEA